MSDLLNYILDHEDSFKNRARLSSLWSDFPLHKVANPDGYAANINAWKKALFHASRAGLIPTTATTAAKKGTKESGTNDVLVLSTGQELARALEYRPWGIPAALASVVQEAVANRELVPLSDFQTSKYSIYSRSWIPTPWQVIQWSLRQIGLTGGPPNKLSVGRFVVVENVEAAANAVILLQNELHRSTTSGTYSLHTFTHHFSHVLGTSSPPLTQNDILVLLTYMSRDKPTLSYSRETSTIKFTSPTSAHAEEITETDISIAQIKSLQLSLELAIPPLESRLESLTSAVRNAVQRQQLSTARSLLKSKKLVESTLEKRRANLLQVEESLHAIDNAADHVAIIQSMQKSAAVMKTLNESVGGVEGVERITDALRDEMAVAEDIGRIIAEPGAAAVPEEDVEDEFEALVEEEKRKVEEKERAERERKEAVERAAREKQEAFERAEREKKEEEERAEREKREVNERIERALERTRREKREREEAEATSKRLAELESFELKKEEERKQAEALSARLASSEAISIPAAASSTEQEESLSRSMEMMRDMKLAGTKPATPAIIEEKQDENKEPEPMLAS
ncbi:hypothetical protein FKW77_004883 [Venturia effusa]|uniref:Charged multivesicular body protein 7 n=1 Tax=Venturia effusa TaxID=50376 RepID=A0A517LCB7_9PEZI|nr:hypothetical protein FKW77_004883 [Venturia effusa]